jgi:2-isopropylmalate synthase
MTEPHPLIYDWNRIEAPPRPREVLLDDETLRDGLQSPSVRCPTIDEKLAILHLIDALGIDTADIGLPGAGPHVVADVERLAREISDQRLNVKANCAARTVIADIRPIAEISQRVGIPIEACCFIGSSPLRQYAEGWSLDQLLTLTVVAIGLGSACAGAIPAATADGGCCVHLSVLGFSWAHGGSGRAGCP